MQEIWMEYKRNNVNVWEVSNYGNVKLNGKPYECRLNNRGYKRFRGDLLHKVVAKLFMPNPEDKPEVDHIDTDKLNNHVNNLRWCTQKENNNNPKTRQRYSEAKIGEKHPKSKKCVYNGIVFGCIKDAWEYAVKYDGYTKSYKTFRKQFK